jgi:hypothetical protein
MAAKNRQQPLSNAAVRDEFAGAIGEFVKAGPNRANRQNGARLTKHVIA